MGRGPLRLRSLSAHHRGFLHLGYFREVCFVALLMGAVLTVQQTLRSPAAPADENPHSEQPVYGLGVTASGRTLWVARERYGISHIDLATGTETDRWMLLQSEASFVSEGGHDDITTIRFGMDHRLDLIRNGETIHSEVLSKSFDALSDTDISSDGQYGAAISNTGTLAIWTISQDGNRIESAVHEAPKQLDHVSFSRDGKTIAIVNWESVYLWSREEQRITASWKVNHGAKPTRCANRADAVAWSPDGQRLALGFDDGMVRVWSTQDSTLLWEHQADAFKSSAVAFDSTGTKLATGGFENQIRLWDIENSKLVWERKYHQKAIHNLTFAGDGSRLYSGGLDGKVCEWAAATGEVLRHLP